MFYSMIKMVYALFMTITEISCTNMVNLKDVYKLSTVCVSGFNLIAKLLIFSYLMLQLRFYQDFEYKRLMRNLSTYFIVEWLSYLLCIYYFFLARETLATEMNLTNAFFTILYLLNVPLIFVGLSIIYLKDLKDPI